MLLLQHDLDDFFIGLAHALSGKTSDVAYGIFNAFRHDAVACIELPSRFRHFIAQDACFDRHCDLRGTGRLRAVTNRTGQNRYGVYDRMGNLRIRTAKQKGDTCTATTARTDRTAICRQTTDSRLLMHRHEIRHDQSTEQAFMVDAMLTGVNDNGDRSGNALVAAAGNDADRQLTATHMIVLAISLEMPHNICDYFS